MFGAWIAQAHDEFYCRRDARTWERYLLYRSGRLTLALTLAALGVLGFLGFLGFLDILALLDFLAGSRRLRARNGGLGGALDGNGLNYRFLFNKEFRQMDGYHP